DLTVGNQNKLFNIICLSDKKVAVPPPGVPFLVLFGQAKRTLRNVNQIMQLKSKYIIPKMDFIVKSTKIVTSSENTLYLTGHYCPGIVKK
ncbi:hypothetical protein ACFL47_06190, partial [Candidatus Latescibacterota bacterium]